MVTRARARLATLVLLVNHQIYHSEFDVVHALFTLKECTVNPTSTSATRIRAKTAELVSIFTISTVARAGTDTRVLIVRMTSTNVSRAPA